MGIFYVLTVIAMFASFVLVKKSNEKLNLISWMVLGVIAYLGFNILICMTFGVLNIKTDLLFLSVANLVVTVGLGVKIFKDKKIQSFEIRKRDILAVIICCAIVCYMAVNQYTPLAKTVATASVDGCMHYSAATNFADNMKILAKINNTTGYNFKTMQTGAYINTGIFMSIVRSIIPQMKDYVTFKIFEMGILTVNILAFYMLISESLKTKKNYLIGIVFLLLYAFAYPYTSLLYGFSYLSVAIAFTTGLFYLAKIYKINNISNCFILPLIVLMGIGIIFSYCLFVPALFAFICIYVFLKDLKDKDEKKYLKIFGKNTLIVTGILLIVTVLAILYLVVPTITDSDQNKLTDAIGFDGGIYKALFKDFLFYIPFVVLFIYKTIKNKEINFEILALVIIGLQTLVSLVGVFVGVISPYYYYKIYYIIWILLVNIAVKIMAEATDNKELMVLLKAYVLVWLVIIYSAISGIDTKIKMRVPVLTEDGGFTELAGIYYDTNVYATLNINVSCIVDKNRVALAEAMGQIEGINLDNMLVGGMNTNCKAWIYVIAGLESGSASINELQRAEVDTKVSDFMKDNKKKFFVLFTADEYSETDDYKVVFQNQAGVILEKK